MNSMQKIAHGTAAAVKFFTDTTTEDFYPISVSSNKVLPTSLQTAHQRRTCNLQQVGIIATDIRKDRSYGNTPRTHLCNPLTYYCVLQKHTTGAS
eukprot:scaffold132605_cov31-Prasinocladus_malaysianus.AAC.1